jgi:hypothetical protein
MSARVLIVEFKQTNPAQFQLGVEMPCTMKQFFLDDLFLGDFVTESECFSNIDQTLAPNWSLVMQEYEEYIALLIADETTEDDCIEGEWGDLDKDTAIEILEKLKELNEASQAGAYYNVFISC